MPINRLSLTDIKTAGLKDFRILKEVGPVTFLKTLYDDESGATAIEYGILMALIATAIIAGAGVLGGDVNNKWDGVAAEVEKT